MPIEVGLWKMGVPSHRVEFSAMETEKRLEDVLVDDGDGNKVPITGLSLKISLATTASQQPEKAEHLVRVEWIKTVPVSEAIREKGFFGNKNSAAKPRSKKLPRTVERLNARLGVND